MSQPVRKVHRNIGTVILRRVIQPFKDANNPGFAEVELPSGELRTVDLSWLTDPLAPKIAAPKDAPVPTPDAKPK